MFYSKGLGRGLIGRTKEGLEVALNSLLPPGPAPSNMSNLHHPGFTFSFGTFLVILGSGYILAPIELI